MKKKQHNILLTFFGHKHLARFSVFGEFRRRFLGIRFTEMHIIEGIVQLLYGLIGFFCIRFSANGVFDVEERVIVGRRWKGGTIIEPVFDKT